MAENDPEFEKRQLLQKIFRLFVECRDLGVKIFVLDPKTVKTPLEYADIKKAQSRIAVIRNFVNVFGLEYFRISGIQTDKTPFAFFGDVFGPFLIKALFVKASQAVQKNPKKRRNSDSEFSDFFTQHDLRRISRVLNFSLPKPGKKVRKNREIGSRPEFRLGPRKREL